jgi:hypothetical protein
MRGCAEVFTAMVQAWKAIPELLGGREQRVPQPTTTSTTPAHAEHLAFHAYAISGAAAEVRQLKYS